MFALLACARGSALLVLARAARAEQARSSPESSAGRRPRSRSTRGRRRSSSARQERQRATAAILRRVADHLADRAHRGALRLRHRSRLRPARRSDLRARSIRAATGRRGSTPTTSTWCLGARRSPTPARVRRSASAASPTSRTTTATSRTTTCPASTSGTSCSTRLSAQPPIHIAGSDEGALWDAGEPRGHQRLGDTSKRSPSAAPRTRLRAATVHIVSDSTCSSATTAQTSTRRHMVCAGAAAGAWTPASGTAAARSRPGRRRRLPARRDHRLGRRLRPGRMRPASTPESPGRRCAR